MTRNFTPDAYTNDTMQAVQEDVQLREETVLDVKLREETVLQDQQVQKILTHLSLGN